MERPYKILYAIQGTGNGHVARAREIIPLLEEFGKVDVALSGDQSHVSLPREPAYRSKGFTFVYNSHGGVSYLKTFCKNNYYKILREIRSFPVEKYDLVINDFEFITAWACKFRQVPCIGLGHQASFQSRKAPRPERKDRIGEVILKHYAPCHRSIGFHFDVFDTFIHRPVIRREIRDASPSSQGHYTVYLPAYSESHLHQYLSKIPGKNWEVFSKTTTTPYRKGNVRFHPVTNDGFIQSFIHCEGILTSAGFETPAEALYMGKKLFVIPIRRQYEQLCNAMALETLGVPWAKNLDALTLNRLQEWVEEASSLRILFPDTTRTILEQEVFGPLQEVVRNVVENP